VGGAGKAHKEQAASDGRRVSGTIRAPLMDNGALHLESYRQRYDLPLRTNFIHVSHGVHARGIPYY